MPLEEQKPLETTPKPEGETEQPTKKSFLSNKGLLIAAIFVIIALIIGASTLIGLGSTDQYQGYIRDLDSKLQDEQTTEVSQEEVTQPEVMEPSQEEPPESPLPTELDENVKIVR